MRSGGFARTRGHVPGAAERLGGQAWGPLKAPQRCPAEGEPLVNDAGLPYEILSIHRVFDPKADTFVADREPQS